MGFTETDFSTEKRMTIHQSPADIESNFEDILDKLGAMSEEDVDDKKKLSEEKVWIVDPLDGTTDFVNKLSEFTIMVRLVEKQKSILS